MLAQQRVRCLDGHRRACLAATNALDLGDVSQSRNDGSGVLVGRPPASHGGARTRSVAPAYLRALGHLPLRAQWMAARTRSWTVCSTKPWASLTAHSRPTNARAENALASSTRRDEARTRALAFRRD